MIIDASEDTKSVVKKLAAAGVTSVGRYYCNPKNKSKILKKDEALAICAEGMTIFTVFEIGANPELDFNTGKSHASMALKQAKSIGQPKDSAIYFAFDSDLKASDVAGVQEYYAGVKSVIGGDYKLGVYSDGTVCKAVLDSKVCEFAWLSASRGFDGSRAFYASRRWALAQDPHIDQSFQGIKVDFDEVNGDFGAFVVGSATRAARTSTGARTTAAPLVARKATAKKGASAKQNSSSKRTPSREAGPPDVPDLPDLPDLPDMP
jgi:Domain of unknown function (DUF1906)